jgi:hypothetical protein
MLCALLVTKMSSNKVKDYSIAEIIRQAFDEIAMLYSELKPFDKLYDEDLLECKYQQREMISYDIAMLKQKKTDSDRLKAFEDLLEDIDSDIEMLTITRMVVYSKWKVEYMSICSKIHNVQNKISSLMQLERNMHNN